MKKREATVPHDVAMFRLLRRRPSLAVGYLNDALEAAFAADDPALVLPALSNVAKAAGMTRVAREAKLQRESLHRMLSKRGNPKWNSLFRVLRALNLRLRFERVKPAAAA